jgi:two-component system sensor kinase FixL
LNNTGSYSQLAEAGTLPLRRGLLLYLPLIVAGNLVGVFLRYPEHGSAILFPPYAALTAVLIASHRRHWIVYIVLAWLCHLAASIGHWPLSWVLWASVANFARAAVAALLILRLLGPHPRLDSVSSLVRFVIAAALVAPAVGATIGAANVVLHDVPQTYVGMWTAWFVSNALTALTMLPLLLEVVDSPATWRISRLGKRRSIETACFGVALAVTCVMVLLSLTDKRFDLATALYAPIPVLLWAGLRFGPAGTGLALSVLTAAAILGTERRMATVPSDGAVLRLQVFVFLTAMPMLCVAVVANALQNAVLLYRALLASLHDQVAILDAKGMVIRVNDSWQRHADAPSPCPFERARVGDNFLVACRRAAEILAVLHPENRDPAPGRLFDGATAVLSGAAQRFETDYELTHDGRREWFIMRVESLERADGGAVVTRANVSLRRQAQAEIEEQRRQISHLGRVAVLGQLSGAIAHELRQPLAAILANAEAARHFVERKMFDSAELHAILLDIVAEDRRAANVIDGLRAMHKRSDIRLQPIEPAELVHEALGLAHVEIITRGVTATGIIEPAPPLVLADRVQIQHVLLNLVLNACESMSEKAAAERLLSINASAAGTHVRFSVRDSGTGIRADLIEHLFDPFVTTKAEGLGLGLSIARTVVETHGGQIWAENSDECGAMVSFLLPAAAVQTEGGRPPDAAYSIPSPMLTGVEQ